LVTVPLDDALDMIVGAEVVAEESVPPFANTAMDGYAVRAQDTRGASVQAPVVLEVVGQLAAGQAPTVRVDSAQAVRIMTGAPLPEGADAVVMVELTSVEGSRVRVQGPVAPGEHVRPAGDDIRPGQVVIGRNEILTPARLGVLASLGVTQVEVHRRPRVGVLSTGDELVEGPAPLGPGQIRDSNRASLLGLLRQSGLAAVDLGLVHDQPDQIAAAVSSAAAACDAVLTSGGVSVGDFDYVKVVLDQLSGGDMAWMQVAVRPAKPFAFGRIQATPVFGLPGNPVSSSVSFELFARPALRQMMGYKGASRFRPTVSARAGHRLPGGAGGRLNFLRVRLAADAQGHLVAESAGGQGSHMLSALGRANALAVVSDPSGVEAGQEVPVWLTGELLPYQEGAHRP
jgi:molybdopterin molybdotransferase